MEFKISKKKVTPRPEDPLMFTLSECLASKDPMSELSSQACKRIYGEGGSMDRLGDSARILFLVSAFDGEMINGGLSQFFCNTYGNFSQETLLALKTVKAKISSSILEKAVELLGLDEFALKNRMSRYEAIEKGQLSSELDKLDSTYSDSVGSFPNDPAEPENIWMLCHSFMEQHAAESIDRV